jgi:cell cycle arrest protein BUB3
VRCYQYLGTSAEARYKNRHALLTTRASAGGDGPVLSLCTGTGNDVYYGGQSQAVCWDLSTNESYVVGTHDAPISFLHFQSSSRVLISASWDKTIRLWDSRASTAVGVITPPTDRIYCGHILDHSAIFATAERKVVWFDLRYQRVVVPMSELTCF